MKIHRGIRIVILSFGCLWTLVGAAVFLHWLPEQWFPPLPVGLVVLYGGPMLVAFAGPRYLLSFAGPLLICSGWVIVMLTMDTELFFFFNILGMTLSLLYATYVLVNTVKSRHPIAGAR